MIRMKVNLTEQQSDALKERAKQQGISVAELIRQAVDRYIYLAAPHISDEEQRRLALAVVGSFRSGVTDLSENHDRYLAEAYAQVEPMDLESNHDSADE